jgi:outer membrane protein
LPEENFNINYTETPENIYAASLQNFAQIKSVRLRTQSAEKAIASAKGELFPTLSLGGNLNTNYSSVATQSLLINTTDVPSSNYVIINGSQVPVITKQNNYSFKYIDFGNQLSNNLFSTINISLRIPIFNAVQTKNKIRLAKIDFKNSELIEQNAKTELQQSIERAYVNLSGTQAKYKLLQEQVASFNESFRAADVRFNAGAITSVDYLIAKNNLDKSKTNLIIAKYDFVLRSKVLDYYQGKALW